MSRSLRLLLVEDHLDSAELLAELLEHDGHVVRIATTASAAIELARTESFDVVVSDVGLPDGSGYELMELLRARYALRGIAVSGSREDVERGRAAGFSAHLVKPVTFRKLVQAIDRVVVGA